MKSDCESTSEPETQREKVVQTVQKKTEGTPRPNVTAEEQCSDQNAVLTHTGVVKLLRSLIS